MFDRTEAWQTERSSLQLNATLVFIGGRFHRHIALFSFLHGCLFGVAVILARTLDSVGSLGFGGFLTGFCLHRSRRWRSAEDRLLQIGGLGLLRRSSWRNVSTAEFGNDMRTPFGVGDVLQGAVSSSPMH